MKLSFECPRCAQRYDLDLTDSVSKVQCASCAVKFFVHDDGRVELVPVEPALPPPPVPVRASVRPQPVSPPDSTVAPKAQAKGGSLKWAIIVAALVAVGVAGFLILKKPGAIGATASKWPNPNASLIAAKLNDPLALADALQEKALSALKNKADASASLVQYELLRACGPEKIAAIVAQDGGRQFLTAFLDDPAWVESFLTAGPPAGSPAQALENLFLLQRNGRDLDKPVFRRMAAAMALEANAMNRYRLVDRFRHTQQAFRDGLLHVSFASLDVRSMRWAVYLNGNARDYQYLLDDRQNRVGDYFGACWACWYLTYNVYGDTIQGPLYYQPWNHVWEWPENVRLVGGVCGSLSTYGSRSARAHGIPSTPVGQPGHCAYIIRVGEEWPVAYDVDWPTGFQAPGWEGTGYATAHRLYERIYQDQAALLAAHRQIWAARLLLASRTPQVRILPGLTYKLYRQGVSGGLPDFSKLTPATNGVAVKFDLAAIEPSPPVNFGVVWEGQVELPAAAEIKAAIRSDDNSRLYLDNQSLLTANCNRSEKTISLAAGKHPVRVEFSQGGGARYLEVELGGIQRTGEWTNAYERAIDAQPANYGTWLEYFKALEATTNVPTGTWRDLARRAAKTFEPYPEAGWALVHRAAQQVLPGMEPSARLAFLVECHRDLKQSNAPEFVRFPLDGVLNWQADRLGDNALALQLFVRALEIHDAKPPQDWIFSQVLNWGQNRFGNNPATAPQFVRAIDAFFRNQGDGMNKDTMRSQITAGIRSAGEKGDLDSARLWADMAERYLPAVTTGDLQFSPAQAAAFPKLVPFPGVLLSTNAVLRLSTASSHDRPLSHRALLRGSGLGGFLHTADEENPWVQVQLPGDGILSGINIVNRYEAASERAVPLKISSSTDGRKWTEIASFNRNEPVFRADLSGKNIRARYVRIERPATSGRREAFNLRAIQIYGQKLY